jgi:hypothetical protein
MAKYRSVLKGTDILYATSNIVLNKWVEIGEKKIEAGVYYAMGFGYSNAQSDADGRAYSIFKDGAATPVEVVGTLRVMAYTPDEIPIKTLGEFPTSKLNSSASDLTKQLPFPILGDPTFLGQDYRFKFFFKADSVGNSVLTAANCVVSLDVTKQSKSGI